MTPERPALAEVLGVVGDVHWWADADAWRLHLREGLPRIVDGGIMLAAAGFERLAPWRHTTPAEALEALTARGLWPDVEARWWCDACQGYGCVTAKPRGIHGQTLDALAERCVCARRSTDDEYNRLCVEWVSDLRTPPSHAALVAVASLGAQRVATAHALASEIAALAGCAKARVVWRVAPRETIDDVNRGNAKTRRDVVGTFGNEALCPSQGIAPWPATAPWYDDVSRAAWPLLRDLYNLGLHLVGLDAERVVIAVEGIGGEP